MLGYIELSACGVISARGVEVGAVKDIQAAEVYA